MPKLGRPSPAMVVAVAAVVLASAGTAFAASQIHGSQIKNRTITGADVKWGSLGGIHLRRQSVGGGRIRPFTGGLIKNETLPGWKVRDETIRGDKLRDKTLTGKQIDVDKLGTVPEAATLEGDARYSVGIRWNETREVATVGPFKLFARCLSNVTDTQGRSGRDVARVVISTAEAGSLLRSGIRNKDGSSADELLNPTTASYQRIVLEHSLPFGQPGFGTSGHFTAMAPSGATASSPAGASSAALHYGKSPCTFSGSVLGTK